VEIIACLLGKICLAQIGGIHILICTDKLCKIMFMQEQIFKAQGGIHFFIGLNKLPMRIGGCANPIEPDDLYGMTSRKQSVLNSFYKIITIAYFGVANNLIISIISASPVWRSARRSDATRIIQKAEGKCRIPTYLSQRLVTMAM
jgi:hypothetical protein